MFFNTFSPPPAHLNYKAWALQVSFVHSSFDTNCGFAVNYYNPRRIFIGVKVDEFGYNAVLKSLLNGPYCFGFVG
jgi:hypothetical protein